METSYFPSDDDIIGLDSPHCIGINHAVNELSDNVKTLAKTGMQYRSIKIQRQLIEVVEGLIPISAITDVSMSADMNAHLYRMQDVDYQNREKIINQMDGTKEARNMYTEIETNLNTQWNNIYYNTFRHVSMSSKDCVFLNYFNKMREMIKLASEKNMARANEIVKQKFKDYLNNVANHPEQFNLMVNQIKEELNKYDC